MKIQKLYCSQYRCWEYETFQFHPELVYIQGPNGSGKTSVLEAIRFLSQGRSFRTHRDSDCIQQGTRFFTIRGEFSKGPGPESISLRYGRWEEGKKRKLARIDGEPLSRLSDLQGSFPTVLFTPDDLRLIKQGPNHRRRYLNELLSQIDPRYLRHLQDYEQYRNQRNEWLKRSNPDPLLLESLEESMAEHGQYVMERRQSLIPQIERELNDVLKYLAEDRLYPVKFRYKPGSNPDHSLLEELADERPRALRMGYTTIGPQRDDWMLRIEDRPVDRFASQGETRALVLALKWVESSVIINEVERRPVLLFDDMESELDETRFDRCLELSQQRPCQLIFTGTRPVDQISFLDADQLLSIN